MQAKRYTDDNKAYLPTHIVITVLFSVLCSTGVLILFKLLPGLGTNTAHTILSSYAISALVGLLLLPVSFTDIQPLWLVVAAFEGVAFYLVFHLMARSALLSGVAFTSVASKMSVVVPITIGLTYLGESGNAFVFAGVASGLLAVILTVGSSISTASWQWPALVFIGTGAIDASFKLFQVWGLAEHHFPAFIICIFAFAFITGLIRFISTGLMRIAIADLLAGTGLGLLNLGTVYFLMNALAISSLDSTVVYALNSFGIVLMSMLVAVGVFREPISGRGYFGISMAFASIVCLYLSHVWPFDAGT